MKTIEIKYNKAYTEGGDFESYIAYLETIRKQIPDELFEFVSNPDRHNFSNKSLHDSLVKELKISRNLKSEETDISIVLLGAYNDREFEFYFENVQAYTIHQENEMYCDLITYEIAIEQDEDEEDILVFRAVFAVGQIEIFAEIIKISEMLFENKTD